MKLRKDIIILTIMILALLIINYSWVDKSLTGFLIEGEEVFVFRIIDGDTIEINNQTSVRLLGINSPERGEKYYEEAKEFLREEILNKTVRLEYGKDKTDKYGRVLAYVSLGIENINIKLVEEGFANYYFYEGRDEYSDELEDAWNSCISKNINLCEKSESICALCISLDSDGIVNSCDFDCDITDWEIKEEGRDKFIFPGEILNPGEKIPFDLDRENSGGTLFLRDNNGKLVLWESY